MSVRLSILITALMVYCFMVEVTAVYAEQMCNGKAMVWWDLSYECYGRQE